MTYVSVEISLIWGDGLHWRKAKSLMKKWAQLMGIPPMKLVKSLDKKYSELLTDLSNISTPQ